jgi:predicted amidohydrolase YtcJ
VHETIAALAAAPPPGGLPHRVEHAQCVRPGDIRRMARAGIIASMQPCHILGDIAIADRHWPRARRDAYAMRRMLEGGVTLALGSDVPVESIDPRRSFFAGTQRTDERDEPDGGWFPEQRLTAAEVLHGFTVGAARSIGAGAPAGSLATGALADMTVWGADPLRVPPRELLHIPIRGCIVGGEVHLDGGA